jgi:predicted enzyme related to lactoylglutathione lyase
MKIGSIVSTDLTGPHAEELKEFYQQVIGWESEDLTMNDQSGTYSDYVMKDEEGNWVAGVCHSRGPNKDLPSQWIVYIQVDNVAESIKKCRELGGKVLKESKNSEGVYQYALLEDPYGAVLAITKVN